MDLSNLSVIVTGASKGIGYTLASMLSKYGAKVTGIYNNTLITNVPFKIYKCDITKEEEVKKLFSDISNVNVVVNCAALSIDNEIEDKSIDEFMEVVKVNLGGTFLINKYASLTMKKGVIINMSSTDASTTYSPISMDYCASKSGVENLTKNMALAFPNLKVCALAPNWVDTDTVLSMDRKYLESEMKRVHQDKLLRKEDVSLKIIDMITNDDIKSGSIIKMGDINE